MFIVCFDKPTYAHFEYNKNNVRSYYHGDLFWNVKIIIMHTPKLVQPVIITVHNFEMFISVLYFNVGRYPFYFIWY